MKKLFAILLSVTLLLSGCSFALAELTFSKDGSFPICSEPVKLTVGLPDSTRVEDWETNLTTQLLLERGNFDLDFVTYDSSDYMTKINLMVMGGGSELPDVLFLPTGKDDTVFQWAMEGAIIPLTEYYNDPTISYWFHEAEERTSVDIAAQIVAPDGEIYGIPTLNQSYTNEYLMKGFYYSPWLENLGLTEPQTTEEQYEVFKKICEGDANGDGKKNEIAITGTWGGSYDYWFPYLMNSFVYAGDTNYYTVNNGVVNVAYTTDAWREGLKYIRRLFAEGMIPMETLTQDDASYKAMCDLEGPCVYMQVYNAPYMWNSGTAVNEFMLGASPVAGPEGVRFATYRPSTASISFVVSKNCKNPEAAFRLGDLMCSTHFSIMTRWGAEGVNWDYIENLPNADEYVSNVDGWPKFLVAYDDNAYWSGGLVQNAGYRQTGPYIRQYGIANGSAKSPEMLTPVIRRNNYTATLYQTSGWNPDEVIPKLSYSADESDEISEISTALKKYVKTSTANFLGGNSDINDDAQWQAFVDECNNIGLQEILKVVNTVYTRMYVK